MNYIDQLYDEIDNLQILLSAAGSIEEADRINGEIRKIEDAIEAYIQEYGKE